MRRPLVLLAALGTLALVLVALMRREAVLAVPTAVCPSAPPCAPPPERPVPRARQVLRVHLRDGAEVAMEVRFWLESFLGGLGRPVVVAEPTETVRPRSLVIGTGDTCRQLAASGVPPGVGYFEYGDEFGQSGGCYGAFAYVLRNYHFRHIAQAHPVVWVPNGCRDGVCGAAPGSLLLASRRPVLCQFLGSFTPNRNPRNDDRRAMVAAVQDAHCDVAHVVQHGGSLSPWQYSLRVRQAVFTLCPIGRSNETIRFYEALELGSIPVVVRHSHFLVDQLPDAPVVLLDSWAQAVDRMRALHADPAALDALQARCMAYWQTLQDRVRASIRAVVDKAMGD